jgi:HPt (histidine-containing phosphotransfer) domain-containing protein
LDPDTMTTLEQLAGADPEPVRKIVSLFVEHAPPALARLKAELQQRNNESTASAAHALKSMALSIGARALAVDLGLIESSARNGEIPHAATTSEALRQKLERTIVALQAHFGRSAPGQVINSEVGIDRADVEIRLQECA